MKEGKTALSGARSGKRASGFEPPTYSLGIRYSARKSFDSKDLKLVFQPRIGGLELTDKLRPE
jgi:hypothetical protein